MRRGFWVALGLGAGATGAILGSRWTKKQVRRAAPQSLAREAKGGLMDLSKLVSESIAEGRQAMAEREAQLRSEHSAAEHHEPPGEQPGQPPGQPPAA